LESPSGIDARDFNIYADLPQNSRRIEIFPSLRFPIRVDLASEIASASAGIAPEIRARFQINESRRSARVPCETPSPFSAHRMIADEAIDRN